MKKILKNKLINNFITLGIHLGYFSKHKKDKRMNKFLIGTRTQFELFHINRTIVYFLKFLNFYLYFISYRPFFLFTSTFDDLNSLVYEFVSDTKHSCFTEIWIGGILTNGLIGQYDLICRESFLFQKFRLNTFPNLIFVLNINDDNQKILQEANNTSVPVVAFVDSHNTLDNFEYMVIGNNDCTEAMAFYFYIFFVLSNLVSSNFLNNNLKYRFFIRYSRLLRSNLKKIMDNNYKSYLLSLRLYLRYNFKFWVYRRYVHRRLLNIFRREERMVSVTRRDKLDFKKKFILINSFLSVRLLKSRLLKGFKHILLKRGKSRNSFKSRTFSGNYNLTKVCFTTYSSFCKPPLFFIKKWFSFYLNKLTNTLYKKRPRSKRLKLTTRHGNYKFFIKFLKHSRKLKTFYSKPIFLSSIGVPLLKKDTPALESKYGAVTSKLNTKNKVFKHKKNKQQYKKEKARLSKEQKMLNLALKFKFLSFVFKNYYLLKNKEEKKEYKPYNKKKSNNKNRTNHNKNKNKGKYKNKN